MKYLIPLLLLLTSLQAITRKEFDNIRLGSPITKVAQEVGDPYSVTVINNHTEEYEYIERLTMGGELLYNTYYYLWVVNDHVVRKRFSVESRQPYDQQYRTYPFSPQYP